MKMYTATSRLIAAAVILVLCCAIVGISATVISANDTPVTNNQASDNQTTDNQAVEKSTTEIPTERQLSLCEDYAGLLNESERTALLERLDEISEEYECEVAVVTVNSLEGKTPSEYADDFYDYNGYGWGADDDGILLLIAMDTHDWYITTYGFGIVAFTDHNIEVTGKRIVPYMSNGDWYGAFTEFADCAKHYFQLAKDQPVQDGESYDDEASEKTNIYAKIFSALFTGVVIGLITVTIMKRQLKSVTPNNRARNYIIKDSLRLSYEDDQFLYRNVSRVARPKEPPQSSNSNSSSSHSSGSSTHTSSSGRSHGGGGGKF